jgi:hypothetical protein
MKAEVHIRSQHAKKGRSGFSGPDAYIAVTIAPEGVEVPYPLNQTVLAKRGIEIHYFGEGYREHQGPKSSLGRAIAAAQNFANEKNDIQKNLFATA